MTSGSVFVDRNGTVIRGDSSDLSRDDTTEREVDGLEQALEQTRALSREIDRLTDSARTASDFLKSLNDRLRIPVHNSSSGGDSGSSAGVFNPPESQLPRRNLQRDHYHLGASARHAG